MSEAWQETKRLLAQLAQRAQNETGLMAPVLVRYQQLEKLNDDALAALLRTDVLGLSRLALCKKPVSDARFLEQVRQTAAYANADAAQIANLIRHVDSMDALAQKPNASLAAKTTGQVVAKWSGVVAAARDRDETESANEDNVAGAGEPKGD